MLKLLKEKSQKRRLLLAQQLGVDDVNKLGNALGNHNNDGVRCVDHQVKYKNESTTQSASRDHQCLTSFNKERHSDESDQVKYAKRRGESCSLTSEETLKRLKPEDADFDLLENEANCVTTYTDSSTFLKGTQSANPHNDYCQHFLDTRQRPQNFIRDVGLADRFEEYPKLKELIRLKDELIAQTATPPMYLKCDLRTFDLRELNCKFDVILIEPPLEEYQRTNGVTNMDFWSWNDIENLQIGEVAAQRSFVFLWCGSSDGLDRGRECLKKWGFRRCEDICWIKTNIKNPKHSKNLEQKQIFQRTKEHCLMGIKGTVRRSTDGDFIHANIDIDLIISEEPEYGSIDKPEEIFHIIEHFCLGRRRLHVFGRDIVIRPGWLSIGSGLTNSNWNSETYSSYFNKSSDGFLTGCTERIEMLRPKSPPPKNKGQSNQRNNNNNNNKMNANSGNR